MRKFEMKSFRVSAQEDEKIRRVALKKTDGNVSRLLRTAVIHFVEGETRPEHLAVQEALAETNHRLDRAISFWGCPS